MGFLSCLFLSAGKLGQESQCLQVVVINLDFDFLIKGEELTLRISFSQKQNFRGKGCGLTFQLMQGNELSAWFFFQFWKGVHTVTLRILRYPH